MNRVFCVGKATVQTANHYVPFFRAGYQLQLRHSINDDIFV